MKHWGAAFGAIIVLLIAGAVVYKSQRSGAVGNLGPKLSPTPVQVEQLPVEKQPKVSLEFSQDGYFVTVKFSNLNADQLEYNLIYDATVKNNNIQTGVNDSQTVTGKSTYTKKQLLGSESSGKFTYHQKIQNAVMELTLRDSQGRSIFTATYPFEVIAGSTVSLTASE